MKLMRTLILSIGIEQDDFNSLDIKIRTYFIYNSFSLKKISHLLQFPLLHFIEYLATSLKPFVLLFVFPNMPLMKLLDLNFKFWLQVVFFVLIFCLFRAFFFLGVFCEIFWSLLHILLLTRGLHSGFHLFLSLFLFTLYVPWSSPGFFEFCAFLLS